jgi:hypothetical protein
MSSDRVARIYDAVAQRDGDPSPMHRLEAICKACLALLPVDGAGVMLMAERAHQGTLYATDDRIQQLEELQNSAAEGPCIDSYNFGRPVLEADLDTTGRSKWPLLSAAALKVGIRALFSFPLQLDDTSVGALDLYRQSPGDLGPEQVADARLLAAMATREVLALQALAAPGSLPDQIADLSGDRIIVEQATGMVAAQIQAEITEAARILRQVATEQNRAVAEVARDIVSRTFRMS